MRQQYHSRKIGDDIHIWDVNKLVEQSFKMPIIEISLSDIKELDETFWYNKADGNIPTCRSIADHAKLIEETDLKYPILICGQKRVIDGMHRVCKAYMRGMTIIKAIKIDPMPDPDFINEDLNNLEYDEQ